MDKTTFGGILLAILGIGYGLVLEGGRITQILQPTAALIVLGGTIGAVLVQFPLPIIARAFSQLKYVFFNPALDSDLLISNLLHYSNVARKSGILALEPEVASIKDPFLKESLLLAIDGARSPDLRKMMELQIAYGNEKDERVPKVFEAAAGYAPTIGIVGAVLGLIQVMQHLQNIDEVGKGIAVAFVATIYGVASANLIFLPFAGKLRIRIREQQVLQEMMLEALLSIIEGENPRTIERNLHRFGAHTKKPQPELLAAPKPAKAAAR